MKTQSILPTLSALLLILPPGASAATTRLLGTNGPTIREVDTESGQSSFFANTGQSDIVNGQFVIDSTSRTAYQLGGSRGNFRLGVIDLDTGSSRNIPSDLYAFGIYNGMVLGSDGPQILRIDSTSGKTVRFASTGLSDIVNNQFIVDEPNHRAYQIGGSRNRFRLSSINLLDGTSNQVSTSLVTLGVFKGMLLGSTGSQIRQIDPKTGTSTFFANTGLSGIVNDQFVIDSESNLAYQIGGSRGSFRLSTINLLDGSSSITPTDLLDLSVYTAIPEPSSPALILFGTLTFFARNRRSRTS